MSEVLTRNFSVKQKVDLTKVLLCNWSDKKIDLANEYLESLFGGDLGDLQEPTLQFDI